MEETKKIPFYKKPLTSTDIFFIDALISLIFIAGEGGIISAITSIIFIIGIILMVSEIFKKKYSWYSLLSLFLFLIINGVSAGAYKK